MLIFTISLKYNLVHIKITVFFYHLVISINILHYYYSLLYIISRLIFTNLTKVVVVSWINVTIINFIHHNMESLKYHNTYKVNLLHF